MNFFSQGKISAQTRGGFKAEKFEILYVLGCVPVAAEIQYIDPRCL